MSAMHNIVGGGSNQVPASPKLIERKRQGKAMTLLRKYAFEAQVINHTPPSLNGNSNTPSLVSGISTRDQSNGSGETIAHSGELTFSADTMEPQTSRGAVPRTAYDRAQRAFKRHLQVCTSCKVKQSVCLPSHHDLRSLLNKNSTEDDRRAVDWALALTEGDLGELRRFYEEPSQRDTTTTDLPANNTTNNVVDEVNELFQLGPDPVMPYAPQIEESSDDLEGSPSPQPMPRTFMAIGLHEQRDFSTMSNPRLCPIGWLQYYHDSSGIGTVYLECVWEDCGQPCLTIQELQQHSHLQHSCGLVPIIPAQRLLCRDCGEFCRNRQSRCACGFNGRDVWIYMESLHNLPPLQDYATIENAAAAYHGLSQQQLQSPPRSYQPGQASSSGNGASSSNYSNYSYGGGGFISHANLDSKKPAGYCIKMPPLGYRSGGQWIMTRGKSTPPARHRRQQTSHSLRRGRLPCSKISILKSISLLALLICCLRYHAFIASKLLYLYLAVHTALDLHHPVAGGVMFVSSFGLFRVLMYLKQPQQSCNSVSVSLHSPIPTFPHPPTSNPRKIYPDADSTGQSQSISAYMMGLYAKVVRGDDRWHPQGQRRDRLPA